MVDDLPPERSDGDDASRVEPSPRGTRNRLWVDPCRSVHGISAFPVDLSPGAKADHQRVYLGRIGIERMKKEFCIAPSTVYPSVHASSICELEAGDLLVSCYAGTREGSADSVVLDRKSVV